MSEAVATAEESVVELIGTTMSGAPTAPMVAPTVAPEEVTPVEPFEFDAEFQTKIMVHAMRNLDFVQKTSHLLKPEYFENAGEGVLVNLGLNYFRKHGAVPTREMTFHEVTEARKARVIRDDVYGPVKDALRTLYGKDPDLSDGNAIAERVAEFAQHQAMTAAIYSSVALLGNKQFGKINQIIRAAADVGLNATGEEYDYFERITERTALRNDRAMGKLPPIGITTGLLQIDNLLYHKGWGRQELSVLLGGPKSGKTTALIYFARAAALTGKHVLYCSCEVSTMILSDRFDASISETEIKKLEASMHAVDGKIRSLKSIAGKLQIHNYPSGTLTPSMLRAVIQRYKSPGLRPDGSVRPPIQFDEVVVDYADIMAPDVRTNDAIENSKSIWLGLRAIAHEENVAMLTATQGNREGSKAVVMTGAHVADDYNKVRTADIMISINVTDEERSKGEARLHFAASRNQESGFTIFIKQNLAKMKFIESIVRIE